MTSMQSAVAAELMGGNSTASRFENSGQQIAAGRPDLMGRVSNAQARVLEFLLAGLTEPQIAEKIGRSRHTVHDHTKAIYSSLNVNNRVQLVLLFSQHTAPAAAPVAPAPVAAAPQQARPITSGPISDVVFTQARPIGPAKNLAVA
ncbi:MAG: LuxR C-terminal-related transcriptional regulator [Planctomycetota bacterium]|nr:LuxR C-terminal-related transcriptional regulator [Planctomycetota bacterium]